MMRAAFISSEVFPFAKTGGLADVSCSLPIELAKLGVDVKVFMPKYFHVDEEKFGLHYMWSVGEIPVRVAGRVYKVQVYKSKLPNSSVDIYFIDSPHYFHRHNIYTNDRDEDERFILFNKAVVEFLQRIHWHPDIFHCNDWQTGILPLLVRENYSWDHSFDKSAFLFTIHNVEYQGLFDKSILSKAEITDKYFYPGGPVEFYDKFSFLKTGIVFSEAVNTVSETYAKELFNPEYSAGMEGVLKEKGNEFCGILNGVDYEQWNPVTDKLIYFNYSIDELSGKAKNKKLLLEQFEMKFSEDVPLIGIIMRFVQQKGIDIIAEAFKGLINLNAQWVVLGSGEAHYEQMFQRLGEEYKGKVSVHIGFNNQLAHQIEASSDIFLMPSRFEPCGLNQIYSLKYGAVPVVRKTGGLADTVKDWNEHSAMGDDSGNGFSFNDYSGYALENAVRRAIGDFYNKPVWHKIMRNGMLHDFSWKKSAEKYLQLYNKAIQKRQTR